MNDLQMQYIKAKAAFYEALKGKQSIDDIPNGIVSRFMETENALHHWAINLIKKKGYTQDQIDAITVKRNWMLELS